MKPALLISLTVMMCGLVYPAIETNIAKVIMKTRAEKLNAVDVWIDVLEAKENGIVIDLHIGADVGLEASEVVVAATSSDGNPIPLKFFTSGTINTSLTFIDYLAPAEAKGGLSSVTVTWRGQTKKFPLLGIKK